MRWSKGLKVGGTLAAVAAAGVLGNVSPASAEPGVGVSLGSSTTQVSNEFGLPLCLKATAVQINLANTGTFMAQTAVYVGPSTATFTARDEFWFNPLGIFTDGTCLVPALVSGTLTVTGGTATNGVSCPASPANYTRQGANAYAITTLPGSAGCTVNSVLALSSTLTFTGNQNPCFGEDFPLPLPDPCAAAPEFVGVYAQL